MLKLVTALLGLTLALGSAQAQQEQEQDLQLPLGAICKPIDKVNELVKSYGETALASTESVVTGLNGELYKGRLVIYVNPETYGNTVVIQFPEDDTACILAMGDLFGPVIQDPGI